jgi:hypothetical protein
MSEKFELLDATGTNDYFVYGLGRVDHLGGCARLVFYVPKRCGDKVYNDVVMTVVVPTDQISAIAAMLVGSCKEDSAAKAAGTAPSENDRVH